MDVFIIVLLLIVAISSFYMYKTVRGIKEESNERVNHSIFSEQKTSRNLKWFTLGFIIVEILLLLRLSYLSHPSFSNEWGLGMFEVFEFSLILSSVNAFAILLLFTVFRKSKATLLKSLLLMLSLIFVIPPISIELAKQISPFYSDYIEYQRRELHNVKSTTKQLELATKEKANYEAKKKVFYEQLLTEFNKP